MRVQSPRIAPEIPQPDYPLHMSSFVSSAAVHCLLIVGLGFLTIPFSFERPVYDELIKPNEHQLFFYDFRRKVPDVQPVRKVGRSAEPRGAELSKQTVIATSRNPRSSQVFISVPAPKVDIEQDLPTPILVARLDAIVHISPPHERPKPRQFVAPRPNKAQPKSPIQPPILDLQAPTPPTPVILPQEPTHQLNLPIVAAPPKSVAEAVPSEPGNARADLTVAALHPAENGDISIPQGNRPGSFSKAPTQDEVASGDIGRAKLTAPDLTIRDASPAAARPTATETVFYAERVRSTSAATLSVPLRPSSRIVPGAVDAEFKGRNVYTIVIPMEHFSAYAGDWIVWFADRASKAGETPIMRAPVPFRKIERVEQAPPGEKTRERIQLSATLGRNGKLNTITFLTDTSAGIQQAVLDDLTSWEFQPAKSDGVPVDVDLVLEIPFNLLLRSRDERLGTERLKGQRL